MKVRFLIVLATIAVLFGIFAVGAVLKPSQPSIKSVNESNYIVTGSFDLEPGNPYFVGATQDFDRFTWVGELPEHVTFEFKYISPTQRTNYIVLPLDTIIVTAKDLCEAKADDGQDLMSNDDNIGLWDVNKQEVIRPAPRCFEIKNEPETYNFNLEAGGIYLITVPGNRTWTQK